MSRVQFPEQPRFCTSTPVQAKKRKASNCKPTPVGFEPTRGDPIGLAGRRLNHSAKVSLTRSTRNHGTQTSAHTNAHTPATHAPLHTTRAPSGNTTQTLARPTGERTNMHAANTRRCNTPIGVANGKRPRGPMDKASAHGAGDCRFESCQGHASVHASYALGIASASSALSSQLSHR